jgi:hypothetical protein
LFQIIGRNVSVEKWIRQIEHNLMSGKEHTKKFYVVAYLAPMTFTLTKCDPPNQFDAVHNSDGLCRFDLRSVNGFERQQYFNCSLQISGGHFIEERQVSISFRRLVEVDLRLLNGIAKYEEFTDLHSVQNEKKRKSKRKKTASKTFLEKKIQD